MRTIRILLLLGIVALAQVALFADRSNSNHVSSTASTAATTAQSQHEHTATAQTHSEPVSHHDEHQLTAADHQRRENVARQDMHNRAEHAGFAVEKPDTYGSAQYWASDWELRWVDFENANGHTIRVYHALNRHNEHLRYTSLWSGHEAPQYTWKAAH